MFNFKKFFLLIITGLSISFNGFASAPQDHQEPVQAHICDFNPERDTQPIIDIVNKDHHHWLTSHDNDAYKSFLENCHDDHPWCNIKVLREKEKLAGFVMYRKNHFIKNKGSIRQLAVNEDFRNKGYGKFLASTAIKELNDMGAQHITLFCYKDNVPAQNLYNKMGFKKIEEHVDLTCLKHTTAQKLESTVPQQNNLQQTTNFKQATNFEKEFYDYL